MNSKTFAISVSIFDAATLVQVGFRPRVDITCRCSERAKLIAIEKAKNFVLGKIAPREWQRLYGLTASQFDALYLASEIDPLKHYVFKIDKFKEVTP